MLGKQRGRSAAAAALCRGSMPYKGPSTENGRVMVHACAHGAPCQAQA